MSDVEEPPTKVSKYEMSQTFTQVEEMEEGQEEWLSEGLLTDDDYNPENPDNSTDPDRTRSDLDSQSQGAAEDNLEESLPEESLPEGMQQESLTEETMQEEVLQEEALQEVLQESSLQEATDKEISAEVTPAEVCGNTQLPSQEISGKVEDANIEQALTNMGNSQPETDELDAFLMRNEGQKPKAAQQEESDGNDTDDLLRMLEDDDKSKKVKVNVAKPPHSKSKQQAKPPSSDEDDDDDEFILDSTMVKKLKMAQTIITPRKIPAKAEPEDSTDDESSSGDAETLRKMFGTRKMVQARQVTKQLVRIGNSNALSLKHNNDKRPVTSTPLRQTSIPTRGKSLLKPGLQQRSVVKVVNRPLPEPKTEQRKKKIEPEEIIDEEEFMEDDDFDLREDFADESDSELDKRCVKQRIMRPERMDEDMMSDAESHSEDGSLYDELPSSDSDDMDSWFTLDIRAERAGDYLPLLGNKAYDLLLQEKARVSNRLTNLRQNLTSLDATGKQQADKLRRATAALAEVDDMLKAA